jgi:hypothetical protein
MTIEELLTIAPRRFDVAEPEADALRDLDALQEADLVDVRVSAQSATVAVLLDLRTALQYRHANTAVLAWRGVEELRWSSTEPSGSHRVAHYVMSSVPGRDGGRYALELACLRGWQLAVVALAADFYVGDIPDLPEAPPDFGEDEETIAAGMPAWDSRFMPGWATFVGSAEPGT